MLADIARIGFKPIQFVVIEFNFHGLTQIRIWRILTLLHQV
jgi:hypothetical protein